MFEALAVTVSEMLVPDGVPAFTCRASVKLAVALTARVPVAVQVMVPVFPTAGATQVHPAGATMDWKLVFGGVLCVKVAPALAAAGPSLVTLCV
jgi:hypothetical protein